MALPAEDSAARLFELVARSEVRLRNALYNAITAATEQVGGTLEELARLIELGQFDEALEFAARSGAVALADEQAAVYANSGRASAGVISNALEVTVGFNVTNERAVQHLRTERFRLIREFTAEQRASTRQALVQGTQQGLNPVEQARNFRESVGLTRRQQRAVANYRRALIEGDAIALERRLRDRRFDSTVRQAVSGDKPLTSRQVDSMVDRYRSRYIRYRSEVIGRTEALRAVHTANHEAYTQAIEEGHLDKDQLVRTWIAVPDERTRDSHSVTLDGQERGPDEAFEGDFGDMMFPGDPMAPPEETVQCRCAVTTRMNSIR